MTCRAHSCPRRPWMPGPLARLGRYARHADRHQRLPAPAGRHPVVRARPGLPAAPRAGGGVRPGVGWRQELRHAAAVPGDQASDVADAARPGRGPPGCRRPPRPRPRQRAVRGGRTAGAAGARPAARRGHPPGSAHPRARGRLGGAARRPRPAAPDRGQRRRGDLPRRVLPGPPRAGAVAAGRRADGPAGPWRGRRRVPARARPGARGRPESGSGWAWPAARSWCACPAWSGARGRTR